MIVNHVPSSVLRLMSAEEADAALYGAAVLADADPAVLLAGLAARTVVTVRKHPADVVSTWVGLNIRDAAEKAIGVAKAHGVVTVLLVHDDLMTYVAADHTVGDVVRLLDHAAANR